MKTNIEIIKNPCKMKKSDVLYDVMMMVQLVTLVVIMRLTPVIEVFIPLAIQVIQVKLALSHKMFVSVQDLYQAMMILM